MSLNCIFCGKKIERDDYFYNGPGPPPCYAVECGYCGARGPHGMGKSGDDHEGAKDHAEKLYRLADLSIAAHLADAAPESTEAQ